MRGVIYNQVFIRGHDVIGIKGECQPLTYAKKHPADQKNLIRDLVHKHSFCLDYSSRDGIFVQSYGKGNGSEKLSFKS